MRLAEKTIHEIDPAKVRVFVHRERDPEAFGRIVQSIKKRGQVHPGQVRKLPKDEEFDYGLITGEGRLLAAQRLGIPFRCFIEDQKELEIVGEFLTENLNREPLPWHYKARLVQPELAAGKSVEDIAASLSLTPGHVLKFKRILDKTAPDLERDVAAMPMNEAEVFTALPKKHQRIVMEVFRETKDAQIAELVKKARVVHESEGQLSPTALRKSLERVDSELRRVKEKLKYMNPLWNYGPLNIMTLAGISIGRVDPERATTAKQRKEMEEQLEEQKRFRAALKKEGVNFAKFERLTER